MMACGHHARVAVEYDNDTKIERRIETCETCGTREVEARAAGDVCIPRTRQDVVDLGIDPYLVDAFGGIGRIEVARRNSRRAAPAERDASHPRDTSRRDASRPTADEYEAWRQTRDQAMDADEAWRRANPRKP